MSIVVSGGTHIIVVIAEKNKQTEVVTNMS